MIVPGCRILVRPLKIEELDETAKRLKALGFDYTEQDKRKAQASIDKGEVLQIGPKASADYIEGLEVGDTIGFTQYGGKFVKELNSDETLLVINDEDVIVIFKDQ
jgi:co-chaperonin GroES (HSP10)